jgi:hypothetical protein
MEIFKLFGSVFIENDKANKAIDDTDNKGKGLSETFGKVGGVVAGAGVAIAGAAVAAGAAIVGLALDTAEYAGEINDASKQSSLGVENLQQLKYAAEQSGTAFGDITKAAGKMNVIFADAAAGNDKAKETFDSLGISLTDANGKMKDSDTVFNEAISTLAEMGDTTEATRLGTDLFGKGYVNLKPMLAEGKDGIDKLKTSASDLGLVMSGEAIAAGDQFGDTIDTLKQSVGSVGKEVAETFMPILQMFADWLMENMPTIKAVVKVVFEVMKKVVGDLYDAFNDNVLPVLKRLWAWIEPNLPAIKTAFEVVFKAIKVVIKIVFDIIGFLIDLIIGMAEGVGKGLNAVKKIFDTVFGAIKAVIEGVQKVLDIFNGTKVEGKKVTVTEEVKQQRENTRPTGIKTGMASGGTVTKTGLSWVGENGPELMAMPKGASIIPLPRLATAGVTINITGNTILGEDDPTIKKLGSSIVNYLRERGINS